MRQEVVDDGEGDAGPRTGRGVGGAWWGGVSEEFWGGYVVGEKEGRAYTYIPVALAG